MSSDDYEGSASASAITLVSATIAADGETLTTVFSAAVTIGAGGSGGIVVRGEAPANGPVAATAAGGDTTDTHTWTLASPFYATEVPTIGYAQPGDGLEDGAGDDVASFSGEAVTNNSTVGNGILRDENGDPVPDENGRAIPII